MRVKERSFIGYVEPVGGSSLATIELPFDPERVFGRSHAPVVVTVDGYTFRTNTYTRLGCRFVPLCYSDRQAAGLQLGQEVQVVLAPDVPPRVLYIPDDIKSALAEDPVILERFEKLTFARRREHVRHIDDALRPSTRARRLQRLLARLAAMADEG